jgi:hypothetical protein
VSRCKDVEDVEDFDAYPNARKDRPQSRQFSARLNAATGDLLTECGTASAQKSMVISSASSRRVEVSMTPAFLRFPLILPLTIVLYELSMRERSWTYKMG